jgi:transcriptional regulator with XRE-family HTH domain
MEGRDPDQMRLKLRQLLIAARKAHGWNQTQLAERMNRKQGFVSAYERGRGIEVVELLQIAEALGLDAKAVLDELSS